MSERAVEPVGPLREVRGPSALGGGTRRFFDLLWLIAVTEFRRVYFGTVLGYLWSLIRPLALFGVLLFVFTNVFKAGSTEVQHYPVMLLLGIVLFTFFQESGTVAVQSVVAQEGIVRKTQFPRLVIPLVDRPHRRLQPPPQPRRRARLRDRLRRRASLELAAVPVRACWRCSC